VPTNAAFRVGSEHSLTVQVTDSEDRQKETTWAFTVGENRDFNGDGFRDLFTAEWQYSLETGRVYVIFGSESGFSDADVSVDGWDVRFTGTSSGEQLGYGVAVSDYNGDGYADIAMTQNTNNSNTGVVYVHHGGTGWAGMSLGAGDGPDSLMTGEGTNQYLGYGIVSGDIDGDGYDDLIPTAHKYNSDTNLGRAYVLYGTAAGVAGSTLSVVTDDAAGWISGENASDEFGLLGATGDFDGDGYAEVALCSYGYTGDSPAPVVGNGRVYIFGGSALGLAGLVSGDDVTAVDAALATITGAGATDGLSGTFSGDFDGDGYDDLGVRASGVDSSTGRLYLFYGSAAGIATIDLASDDADAWISGESAGDYFGVGRSGDVNGDGYDDIVASAPYNSTNAGRVYVFYGSSSRFSGAYAATQADATITGDPVDEERLTAGLVGDLNGDGYADIVCGTNPVAGSAEVRIVYGSAAGVENIDFQTDSADATLTGFTSAISIRTW